METTIGGYNRDYYRDPFPHSRLSTSRSSFSWPRLTNKVQLTSFDASAKGVNLKLCLSVAKAWILGFHEVTRGQKV